MDKPNKHGKLSPTEKGPYTVQEQIHHGMYKLITLHGKDIPRTWHSDNLRKYFT